MHPTITSAYARERERELRSVTGRRPIRPRRRVLRRLALVRS